MDILLEKAQNEHELTRKELTVLLQPEYPLPDLLSAADKVRKNMSATKYICAA